MKTHSTIIMDKGQLDFRPFKAWRYNTRQVELSHVIAPPYDVISGQDQESLYARSPYNVVRLILGKEPDFHDQAEKCWVEWGRKGILTQDTHPAFYLYKQTFSHPLDPRRKMKRFALVGVLNLEKADSVLLHEATFAAPRKDRLLLLEKTHTNLSPVFGLYRDSKKLLPSLFASYEKKPKLFEAEDDQDSLHKGWVIEEGKDQALVQKVLASEKILIADGHHRFETALEYRRQMREKFPNTPRKAPFDFVLMALVEFDDPGLLVLPTHRIIRSFGKMTKKEFIERLRPYFDFLPYPEEDVSAELTKRSPSEWVIGVLFGEEGSFLIKPRDFDKIRKALPQEKPPIWYQV
ncbi:MAG: DUF1015 domain-containing protein, partial [Candidatus Omnitrophica bacterium]|nr:DUF1015 domain-containing protein [Candidatus Omnitrophota bacterium]